MPPLPPELAYLWEAFLRLSERRGSNGFGPAAVTWMEIGAFVRLSRTALDAWEIAMIEMIDTAWLRAFNQSTKGRTGANAPPQRSSAPDRPNAQRLK